MRAEAVGQYVKVVLSWNDPEEYLPALNELIEAQAIVDAHRSTLGSAELGPMLGRVAAAESDMDDLFSETISIAAAEKLYDSLFKAIVAVKVNSGAYSYADAEID